jgi:hypothetical protein
MAHSDVPFSTIENAHEFLVFLGEAIDQAITEVREELDASADLQQERLVDAWRVALYKTEKLSFHVATSRRLLNDLRTLRNLLQRGAGEASAVPPAIPAGVGTGT